MPWPSESQVAATFRSSWAFGAREYELPANEDFALARRLVERGAIEVSYNAR
jgi:hypothetical protein